MDKNDWGLEDPRSVGMLVIWIRGSKRHGSALVVPRTYTACPAIEGESPYHADNGMGKFKTDMNLCENFQKHKRNMDDQTPQKKRKRRAPVAKTRGTRNKEKEMVHG